MDGNLYRAVALNACGADTSATAALSLGCTFSQANVTNDAPAVFPVGQTTVTWTVTDCAGNTNSCTQLVVVEDNEDPIVACKDITVQLTASGTATITPADVDDGSMDACGISMLDLDRTTFSCADLPTGPFNTYGLDFDGTDAEVVLPAAIINTKSVFSIEAWINMDNTSKFTVFSEDNIGTNFMNRLLVRKGLLRYNQSPLEPGGSILEGSTLLSANSWYHVAFVQDGSSRKLYLNGALEASDNGGITFASPGFNFVAIGSDKQDAGTFCDGTIDEIRIWNVARSQADLQLYSSFMLPSGTPDLLAYWDMEDGPGSSILTDQSGNGHTGTLTNMNITADWVAGVPAVTALFGSSGIHPVTLSVMDNNGNVSSCSAQVTVMDAVPSACAGPGARTTGSRPFGLETEPGSSSLVRFVVYPNPASGQVYVKVEGLDKGQAEFILFNGLGQEVLRAEWDLENSEARQLALIGLSTGIYHYRIQSGAKHEEGKLIVDN
jgi:hypothetical protein